MRYAIKNHNLQNMDSAIEQYLNTKKSSQEIVDEFGICKSTLFNRLRKIRELQNENKNNELNSKNIQKKTKIKKNDSQNNTLNDNLTIIKKKRNKKDLQINNSNNNSTIIEKKTKNKKKDKEKEDIVIKLIGGDNKYENKYESESIVNETEMIVNENEYNTENNYENEYVSDNSNDKLSEKILNKISDKINESLKYKCVIKINENKCKKKYLTKEDFEEYKNNGLDIYLYDDFVKLREIEINNQVKEYIKNNSEYKNR